MLIWATGMMPASASPALHCCFSSGHDVICIGSDFSVLHTSALHSTCIAAFAHQPCQLCDTGSNPAKLCLAARCAFKQLKQALFYVLLQVEVNACFGGRSAVGSHDSAMSVCA